MAGHDVVVIGASAGGIEALRLLVRTLPEDLPATVLIVVHVAPEVPSSLPQILDRESRLPVRHPKDQEVVRKGTIYVAPPDQHLIVQEGRIRLGRGPRENRHRPAIDFLFRSAAVAFGPRVVAVILTGALDDGTAGCETVKQRGGTVVVQDPAEALHPSMPQSVLENVAVDHRLQLAEIGPLLVRLAAQPVPDGDELPDSRMEIENRVPLMADRSLEDMDAIGKASGFSCPECHGALWEIQEGGHFRYRCHVGHGYSPESLASQHAEELEQTLWAGIRALEEDAALARKLEKHCGQKRQPLAQRRFAERAKVAEAHAARMRTILVEGGAVREDGDRDGERQVGEPGAGAKELIDG